jgi:hypothetical protein
MSILVIEVKQFLLVEFPQRLKDLYGKQDASKSITRLIHETFTEPMRMLLKFLSEVVEVSSLKYEIFKGMLLAKRRWWVSSEFDEKGV